MKGKHKPAYYQKNAALQARKRGINAAKSKKCCANAASNENRRISDARQQTAEVVCLCILAALHDKFGMGEERIHRVISGANQYGEKFIATKEAEGAIQARVKMNCDVRDLLPDGFVLPVLILPKNDQEWVRLHQQRDAADLVFKLYAKTLHNLFGFSKERLAALAAETESVYREFGVYAKDGDYYGYDLLARKMSQILHTPMSVYADGADEPVFGKTLF
jgi:hypothetical protein